jgi:hypothetical protein
MPGNDPHEMQIADGWSRADNFSLDREGFALKDFHDPFNNFDDDEAGHRGIEVIAYGVIRVVEHIQTHEWCGDDPYA